MPACGVCGAPVGGLHFEPVTRAFTGTVRRPHPLRDDAFDVMLGAGIECFGDGAVQLGDGAPRRTVQVEPVE